MKKEFNLTKEEKIDFLANLEYSNLNYDIKLNKNWVKMFACAFGIGALGAGLFTFALALIGGVSLASALTCFPISFGIGVGLLGICSIPAIKFYLNDAKCLKSISNGKITYRDYKELVKNGEIEKWQKEYKKEIEVKVIELEGFTVEDYQTELEDVIISEVKDLIADEKVKLDSERVAEEVKKHIDEHNEVINNESDFNVPEGWSAVKVGDDVFACCHTMGKIVIDEDKTK